MRSFLFTALLFCCTVLSVNALPAAAETPSDCARPRSFPISSGKHYQDYYGSMVTRDKSLLQGAAWGITNPKPQSMAYFGGTLKAPAGFSRFRASISIDDGIKAPLVFVFKNRDRNGEVLKSVTVEPGTTEQVDFELDGVRQLFLSCELRINHDTAKRIVIGNPEFYSCADPQKRQPDKLR